MQNKFLIQQELQHQLQNGIVTNPPTVFGTFHFDSETRLESPDLKILGKVLSEYNAGGLSKKEKVELAQISEIFKQLSNVQLKVDQTPWGKVIPGEMSVVNSAGERVVTSQFFNSPDVIQNLFTDKSKIIAEALKQYSVDGILTAQEIETIDKLSSIMKVPSPIPSGIKR